MSWAGNMLEASSKADQAMCLAEQILCVLRDIKEQNSGGPRVQFLRRPVRLELDGTGAGVLHLDMRAGVDLELISYAGVASATSTGVLLFFSDQGQDPSSLIQVGQLGQYFSDSFSEGDRLPAGRQLSLAVVDGPPNGEITLSVSAKAFLYPGRVENAAWSE